MGLEREITICICTHNRHDLLSRAIESAITQNADGVRVETIVIDNSSDVMRAKTFQKKFAKVPNLNYILEESVGLSNARNVGARICQTPIIAFIDDDAIASPEWARELLTAFETFGSQAAIVGGRVDPIWSSPQPSWLHTSMLGHLSVVNWGGEARVAAPHEWVAGTNIAFRVDDILKHGGFSVKLGRVGSGASLLSNEETELVARISASGGILVYAPEARVNHLVDSRRLSQTWFRKRAAWQALSDFMVEPDKAVDEAKNGWPAMVKYFNALPPLERTIRGLIYETDDPDLFAWQMSSIYTMTRLMLAGFEGTELD